MKLTKADLLYVLPDGHVNSSCPVDGKACKTLAEYAEDAMKYFNNNTLVKFINGTHLLPSGLVVSSVHNFTLAGCFLEGSKVTIICQCFKEWSGFRFLDSVEIKLLDLEIQSCGMCISQRQAIAGVSFINVTNLHLNSVIIFNSHGLGTDVHFHEGNVTIENSTFSHSHGSNARFALTKCISSSNLSLVIKESKFKNGVTSVYDSLGTSAGGLLIDCFCPGVRVTLEKVIVRNNSGGGILLNIQDSPLGHWEVTILQSTVEYCHGHEGSGIYFKLWTTSNSSTCDVVNRNKLKIAESNFTSNVAEAYSGSLMIDLRGSGCTSCQVILRDCKFSRNVVSGLERHGAAMRVLLRKPLTLTEKTPCQHCQHNVTILKCHFYSNGAGDASGRMGSAVDLENLKHVFLQDCSFVKNIGTAISMISSSIVFSGKFLFQSNTGINGGALRMLDSSLMLLNRTVKLKFVRNHAKKTGGAIYVDRVATNSPTACFFQPNVKDNTSLTDLSDIHLDFIDNTAILAGDAIYGGDIDNCFTYSGLRDENYNNNHYLSKKIFNVIFHIDSKQYSPISSDPYQILFCDSQGLKSDLSRTLTTAPGKTIDVQLATAGQHLGVAPALISVLTIPEKLINGTTFFIAQPIPSEHCQNLSITVYSNFTEIDLQLVLRVQQNGPMKLSSDHHNVSVNLNIKKCPWAFVLHQGKCKCYHGLDGCDLQTATVHRNLQSKHWFGCQMNGTIKTCANQELAVAKSCGYDYYCNQSPLAIINGEIDMQCVEGRTGILCGSCAKDHSLVFGTGQCKICSSNQYLSLVLLYLAAGIFLIVMITKCGLTINHGNLSGLIFIANFIHWNQFYFFPHFKNFDVLRLIIAWLNLDFGIEVCFYKGMTIIEYTWLQIGYVVYVVLLQGIVIILCRRYVIFTRFFGRNITKVMATVTVLLYSKVLVIVSEIFMYEKVKYINSVGEIHVISYVLVIDGGILYGSHKHIPLLVVASFLAILLIFLTFSLLFIQVLTRVSNYKCFRWVARLQPFFETFTGPCNSYYAFWPGFLLFVKLFYRALMFDATGRYHSLYAVSGCVLLTTILSFISPSGVYKKWSLNILELCLFSNISIASIIIGNSISYRGVIGYTSVSIALICFCAYHIQFCPKFNRVKKLTVTYGVAVIKFFRKLTRKQKTDQGVTQTVVTVDPYLATERSPLLSAQAMPPVINYAILREPLVDNVKSTQ